MGGAEQIRIRGIRLFRTHLIVEAVGVEELRHFCAAAEFINEILIQPGLINFQTRVGQETVAVEAFNIVTFIRAAVAPDVDAVFLHRSDQPRAGHGAAKRSRVVINTASSGDVESVALDSGNTFTHQLGTTIHQACTFSAKSESFLRNGSIIAFVGLTEISGISIRACAFLLHPQQSGGRIQPAGKSDADFFTDGQVLQDGCLAHELFR